MGVPVLTYLLCHTPTLILDFDWESEESNQLLPFSSGPLVLWIPEGYSSAMVYIGWREITKSSLAGGEYWVPPLGFRSQVVCIAAASHPRVLLWAQPSL